MKTNFNLHMKLAELVEGEGFSLSSMSGRDGSPNYFIDLTDQYYSDLHGMGEVQSLGLTVNPVFHQKPFRIFPNGADVSFDEIHEILLSHKADKEEFSS